MTARVASVLADVRTLGSSAPLRAAYEASKRSNFHALLFRERPGHETASVPVGLAPVVPTAVDARKRCLEDARAIVDEGVRVFGRRVPTGSLRPWFEDPLTGTAWPHAESWWRIDIRSTRRLSDVKFVWEAARHRDLVVLARAVALEPEGPWLSALERMLTDWLAQCPPEKGVNWYSSLELALRAIAWAQVLELTPGLLDPEVKAGLDAQLVASATHIMLELPYTVSSMKNNHLLGDGLGLVVLGRMFPSHPASRRWQRIGDALMLRQLRRHMRPDGSMIEDSLSYHRFVLEMLIVRVLIGGEDPFVRRSLVGASEHLRRLGALDGEVPQFGDWDEGRVLADSAAAGSVAGSAWAGLALTGHVGAGDRWPEFDELAWYVDPVTPATRHLRALDSSRAAGDFEVMTHGDWQVWFKSSGGSSHQHADITSVWIARRGEWVVRDPGTGTYNGPLNVRNGFRSSIAHPVWTPRGEDQLVPHRAFRWLRAVECLVTTRRSPGRTLALSVHDAFSTGDTGTRVARLVDVDGFGVRVLDAIERPTGDPWHQTIPLGTEESRSHLRGVDGELVTGSDDPFLGWSSTTYGQWAPSPWVVMSVDGPMVAWGAGDVAPTVNEDGTAAFGDRRYVVEWTESGARVTVTTPEGSEVVEAVHA